MGLWGGRVVLFDWFDHVDGDDWGGVWARGGEGKENE